MSNTYLLLITSYTFRCLLHHLQRHYCVTCSRSVCFFDIQRTVSRDIFL